VVGSLCKYGEGSAGRTGGSFEMGEGAKKDQEKKGESGVAPPNFCSRFRAADRTKGKSEGEVQGGKKSAVRSEGYNRKVDRDGSKTRTQKGGNGRNSGGQEAGIRRPRHDGIRFKVDEKDLRRFLAGP